MDDCLRCHGMYFEGGVRDLVSPVDRRGPWQLLRGDLADAPSMPCLTCHEMHRQGSPLQKTSAEGRVPGPSQEIVRPSLALFDRRTQQSCAGRRPAASGDRGRRAAGQDEQGSTTGALLPVPRAGRDDAGGLRRRPHRSGRPRRHQLPRVPRAARPEDARVVRVLPPENVELRAGCREDGHVVPVAVQQTQYSFRKVRGLPRKGRPAPEKGYRLKRRSHA